MWCDVSYAVPKSSIEVTTCTSSNILVWFGRDATEKGAAGLTESLISSLFARILQKFRDVVVQIVEYPLYILSSLVVCRSGLTWRRRAEGGGRGAPAGPRTGRRGKNIERWGAPPPPPQGSFSFDCLYGTNFFIWVWSYLRQVSRIFEDSVFRMIRIGCLGSGW